MALKIKKNGKVENFVLHSTDIRVLDVANKFKNKNLESVINQISDTRHVHIGEVDTAKDGIWFDTTETLENSDNHGVVGRLKTFVTNKIDELIESNRIGANAETAKKLEKPVLINNTNFDGSKDITTSQWGTARTVTIGNTAKSVDGTSNVTWTLNDIGASASGHTHDERYYTETEVNNLLAKKADKETTMAITSAAYTPDLLTNSGNAIPITGTKKGNYAIIGNVCFYSFNIQGTYDTNTYGYEPIIIDIPKQTNSTGTIPITLYSQLNSPLAGLINGNKMMVVDSASSAPYQLNSITTSKSVTITGTGFYFIT